MEGLQNQIKVWGAQIRGNFLILSVLLVAIGLSLSALHMKEYGSGSFSFFHALFLIVGVVLAHISVNLFNEYSDYKSGIDSNTKRTPFSGGSGMLQSGLTTPESVLTAANQTLFFAFLIGLYFCIVSHWILIFIIAIGGISVVFYTGYLARWLIGEFFAGFSLGSLVVIGSYVAMTGGAQMAVCDLITPEVIFLSLPPGILTFLLLLLNQFPDVEADREGGRLHLVIWLGREKAAYLYIFGLIMVYLIIILLPIFHMTSWWILLAFLTLPLAVRAGIIAVKHNSDMEKIIPALGLNVMVVLATDALLAVALIVAMI